MKNKVKLTKDELIKLIEQSLNQGAKSFYDVLESLNEEEKNLFYEHDKECSEFVRKSLNYRLDYVDNDYIVYKGHRSSDLIDLPRENICKAFLHMGDVYFNGDPKSADLFEKWVPTKNQVVMVWNDDMDFPIIRRATENDVNGFYDNIVPYLGQKLSEFEHFSNFNKTKKINNLEPNLKEEMIKKLVNNDITDIKKSLYENDDISFLYAVLSGEGFKPYSQFSNKELIAEYNDRFSTEINQEKWNELAEEANKNPKTDMKLK